jgi:hypothetical protein
LSKKAGLEGGSRARKRRRFCKAGGERGLLARDQEWFRRVANHLRSDPRHGWRLRGPQHVRRDGMALMDRFRLAADQGPRRKGRGAPGKTPSDPASYYHSGAPESRHARDGGLANRRLSFSLNRMFRENRRMPPPSPLEVFLFWVVGIVITILSGGVVIYASHLHLWGL